MAEKKAAKLVTPYKTDDGQTMYEFTCPHPTGCGPEANDPEQRHHIFNYADRESVVIRAKQHLTEHETREPGPEVHEFRVGRGLVTPTPSINIDELEL